MLKESSNMFLEFLLNTYLLVLIDKKYIFFAQNKSQLLRFAWQGDDILSIIISVGIKNMLAC
jgi:hypothetical protein